jgi:hypothetical protein
MSMSSTLTGPSARATMPRHELQWSHVKLGRCQVKLTCHSARVIMPSELVSIFENQCCTDDLPHHAAPRQHHAAPRQL